MPGSSRYASEILNSIKATFSSASVEIFENPLVFGNLQPFMDYTRASLSEDRKLWKDFFEGEDEFDDIMGKISAVAKRKLEKSEGGLVMTKVVGGFVAHK